MTTNWRSDAIDPGAALRGYAWTVGSVGLLIYLWGPAWLNVEGGDRLVRGAEMRMWAGTLMAAACFALGAARAEATRTRAALGWFAMGHMTLADTIVLQRVVVFGRPLNDPLNLLLLTTAALLVYLWATAEGDLRNLLPARATGVHAITPTERSDATLRSQYEQQIREAARQEERHRLARELHDSIKQQIFVMHAAAATVQVRMQADATGAQRALEQVRASAREAMTELDAMLDHLRAVPLETSGLIAALRRQCEALGFRTGAAVACDIRALPANELMPPGAQQALYRIAQEALANIGRHARASRVRLTLLSGAADTTVTLSVSDDGAGFAAADVIRGLGLANMEARAREYGGQLTLTSQPGCGTTVSVTLPTLRAVAPTVRALVGLRLVVWSALIAIAMAGFAVFGKDAAVLVAIILAVAAVGVARNARVYWGWR